MRKYLWVVWLLCAFGAGATPANTGDRSADWAAVDKAVAEGLPRTAIEHLEPIIEQTFETGAYAEAARAVTLKIALDANIEGNRPEERIVRMDEEIARAPANLQPLLQAVQAHWFWHFFQANRWRFQQRTATAESPADDIMTWDLPRIFAEIDKRFTQALAEPERLQSIPVTDWDDFLEKGTMSDEYRPTLYDFIAANALEFYASGEQAAARPQNAFILSADQPIFGALSDFLGWTPETDDHDSPLYKAVRLYQDLLRFHRANDAQRAALLNWDLERLRFGYNLAVGEDKDARYQWALQRFVDAYGDHEVSARALVEWAETLHEDDQPAKAHELAGQAVRRFPDSLFAQRARNLQARIEAPSITWRTERVWNQPYSGVDVRYRNVTNAHLRLIQLDYTARLQAERRGWNPENVDRRELQRLLRKEPAYDWSKPLVPTPDYQERKAMLSVPESIEPGFYLLVASHHPEFDEDDQPVFATPVWVSDLALIMGTDATENAITGMVLDAQAGTPIPNAHVRIFRHDYNTPPAEIEPVTTDADGRFRVAAQARFQHLVLVEHDGQKLAAQRTQAFHGGRHRATARERVVFFTDRAIYRPGQAINFKGIVMTVDIDQNRYETVANRRVTVQLLDPNGDEVERIDARANDYGSFSGTFTAPRDRLMGRMHITTAEHRESSHVRVEEYKRPTFQVELEAPQTAVKQYDVVTLTGTATAYTGAPTDDAQVRWRVVRETRFPNWWPWWRFGGRNHGSSAQEIANGVTTSDRAGQFEIQFVAQPDESVSRDAQPTFRYTVYADVTDAAGETRSAQRVVNVGYTALQISCSTDNWLEANQDFDLTIQATTLDGVGQTAAGRITIYELLAPDEVHRAPLASPHGHWRSAVNMNNSADLSDWRNWPQGPQVHEYPFVTEATGHATATLSLPVGAYRVAVASEDRYGQRVRAEHWLWVQAPDEDHLKLPVPYHFDAPRWTVEPGDTFTALWGSGYDAAQAYVEVMHRGQHLQRFWTEPGVTQTRVTQHITEDMRGGITVRVTMVRENRAYFSQHQVNVPWTNKELDLSWERFSSRLEPGQQETWTAVIRGADAKPAVAEMVATLYDQSLDVFTPHNWPTGFGVFYREHHWSRAIFQNNLQPLSLRMGRWPSLPGYSNITYRSFPSAIMRYMFGYSAIRGVTSPMVRARRAEAGNDMPMMAFGEAAPADVVALETDMEQPAMADAAEEPWGDPERPAPDVDLDQVQARENLEETAFFFPHLTSSEDGEIRMTFTMPEALTQWKFIGFAHDRELRSGHLTGTTVTAKELMVQPNPPRFLREGDTLEFTVRVTNQSASRQVGRVRLTFEDARTRDPMNAALGLHETEKTFDVPSQESRTYAWRVHVPDGMGFLVYRAVGATERLSDGEEAYLPVLSRRVFVTESLPLPIRGRETRTFRFDKLLAADESDTLQHKGLTVQMASNPAWYAVMALPYLMEYPHAGSEQVFNRLYANSLAHHIAVGDPRIRRVFDEWKGTDALDSPLEKNEDLKAVALEETPWLRQAQRESQARRHVGLLFERNRLNEETARTLRQLTEQQLASGAWPWFPGGPPNDFITLYIATGFGRLRHLGVPIDTAPALQAWTHLDRWMHERYERIRPDRRNGNHLSYTVALYLYGRTFFLRDQSIEPAHRVAFDYWVEQAEEHWLKLASRQSQAHIALALHRLNRREPAQAIMRSLKERSVTDDELGRFWRDMEYAWWWHRAPIETQAMMIEAFDEVMNDAETVEECRIWLLKQKQTQNWRTTKATADAVYALLLRGTDWLASDALVEVELGDRFIEPEAVEAGTGFYERRFNGAEVTPVMGEITVRKVDDGIAWGSVHWQYLENIERITAHTATPLTLDKRLYTRVHTERGLVLEAVEDAVQVGDELVVRIVLRTDRDMEYVHLKDHRPSGTEPVNVLSRYRFQDGLAYYESTRDTASHFFIDYLPKGTYVFEYALRVQHRGAYESGMATIQCLYAPEFNSHSASIPLQVK